MKNLEETVIASDAQVEESNTVDLRRSPRRKNPDVEEALPLILTTKKGRPKKQALKQSRENQKTPKPKLVPVVSIDMPL